MALNNWQKSLASKTMDAMKKGGKKGKKKAVKPY